MKRTEIKDLKSKNLKDLVKKVQDLKKELVEILIEKSLGKLKDSHKVRSKRIEIAQAITFVAQKKFVSQQFMAEKSQENKEKQK